MQHYFCDSQREQTLFAYPPKKVSKFILNFAFGVLTFYSWSFCDGMILIIAYRMGNRQVITKVPTGMLRGNNIYLTYVFRNFIHLFFISSLERSIHSNSASSSFLFDIELWNSFIFNNNDWPSLISQSFISNRFMHSIASEQLYFK